MGSNGLLGFGLGGFMWSIGVWLPGCKEQEERVLVMQGFC